MAPTSCQSSNCNATFSTTSNRNKHERKKNHYPSSTKAREHCIPFDEAGKVHKCKNNSCKVVSEKKSNMGRHIKTCSEYSAKIKKEQNNKVWPVCRNEFLNKFNRGRHIKTMHSQFEASEEHFNKTNNDGTINQNLTNSDVDFTVPTLEMHYEFPTVADVSIVHDDFDCNELCSTHIETEENIQEMSNDMPPASNEESTTELASTLLMNLFNLLTRG